MTNQTNFCIILSQVIQNAIQILQHSFNCLLFEFSIRIPGSLKVKSKHCKTSFTEFSSSFNKQTLPCPKSVRSPTVAHYNKRRIFVFWSVKNSNKLFAIF